MKPLLSAVCLFALLAGAPTRAAELTETDLAALRYFQSIDDQPSVAAEIQRLGQEFPGADIQSTLAAFDATARQVDTSPIWRAIEAKDYAAARAAIAETQAANAGWTPPADMVLILDSNEGQERFETAFAAKDRAGVIDALARFPAILNCDRINNAWRLAELQIADALAADAVQTFDGVLRSCAQEDYVVATLQKASGAADEAQLAALFATARAQNPGLAERLVTLETELAGPPPEAPKPAPAPQVARAAPAPTAPTASGGGSGGSGGGQAARAAAAADRGDWGTCLELTSGAKSVEMVNQRAWCAYNHGRTREAVEAFRQVASQGGGAMARDATYGLILAYARLGQLDQAASLASGAKLTGEQRRVVNQTVISKLATASFEKKQYRQTLDYLDRLSRDSGSLDRGLAMMRGWALLKSGRKGPAREQFSRIHAASPGKDSLQGMIEAR